LESGNKSESDSVSGHFKLSRLEEEELEGGDLFGLIGPEEEELEMV
jgi:hypothetical protein